MRRVWAALAVAVACTAALPLGGALAAPPCLAVRYVAALQRAAADVAATPPDIAAASATISGLGAADTAVRRTLAPIAADLAATPPDVRDARAVLEYAVQVLALPPGAACAVDPGPARAALHDVYSSPVFANLDQNVQPSVLQRILKWIGSLFSAVGGTLGAAGSIAFGAVVLALVLALAAWRLRGSLASAAARIEAEPEASDDPAREWMLADRAAARGEYREAIRRAFRSALLETARRGRLPVDASWTTRELLAAARGDADMLASLAPAAAVFDRAWYSGERVGAGEWELARARCDAVRSLARARLREGAV